MPTLTVGGALRAASRVAGGAGPGVDHRNGPAGAGESAVGDVGGAGGRVEPRRHRARNQQPRWAPVPAPLVVLASHSAAAMTADVVVEFVADVDGLRARVDRDRQGVGPGVDGGRYQGRARR